MIRKPWNSLQEKHQDYELSWIIRLLNNQLCNLTDCTHKHVSILFSVLLGRHTCQQAFGDVCISFMKNMKVMINKKLWGIHFLLVAATVLSSCPASFTAVCLALFLNQLFSALKVTSFLVLVFSTICIISSSKNFSFVFQFMAISY